MLNIAIDVFVGLRALIMSFNISETTGIYRDGPKLQKYQNINLITEKPLASFNGKLKLKIVHQVCS